MLRAITSVVRRVTMSSSTLSPEVVFVLGGPGAGKGTLCRYVCEKHGYVHLSAGDLLREERAKPGSQYGELIEGHIKNGSIVPVEITCSLLERAMRVSENPHRRFLIDGFPRNQDNLDGWNKSMGDKTDLKAVLYCECSEEVCTQRCIKRGAAGSGRTDDNKEVLIRRHTTFIQQSLPIIQHYEKKGLVYKINSMKTPDEVFEEVQLILPKFGW